jgi:hypothetical protein
MQRVLVLVEGQTEEAFIGRSLQPHLQQVGVHLVPTVVVTRVVRSGPNNKGGVGSWKHIRGDLQPLLRDSSLVAVTTMLDYYGLPGDVPGMSARPDGSPEIKATHVQSAIDDALGDPRLRCYLSLHEFEALLYSDPDACSAYLGAPGLSAAMQRALRECGSPEAVNDDPNTAPSKRIVAAYPRYKKVLDGVVLAEQIGLSSIRSACPHFNSWLTWLESLGAE